MNFDKGLNGIISSMLGSQRRQSEANNSLANKNGSLSKLRSAVEGSRLARKTALPDRYEARKTGESIAGQVHSLPKGLNKPMHSTGSTRGQRVLENLIFDTNPKTIDNDANQVSELGTAVNSRNGHGELANLFQAADQQRNDLAA